MESDFDFLNRDDEFRYGLLGRMQRDCEYYLGNGGRHAKHLWSLSEVDQIENMKLLWESFGEDAKPEWLTWDEILAYEREMVG